MTNEDSERRLPPRVNLATLERSLGEPLPEPPTPPPADMPSPLRYAQPVRREAARINPVTQPQLTPLQMIAKLILELPWRDAEAMGKAIDGKKQDGKSTISGIMDWAFEWETFRDEERPTPRD